MGKFTMYFRMLTGALIKRKARVLIALTALVVGTGIISGVMNVYYDINIKMSKELRSYGANFVLSPQQGELISVDKAEEVADKINRQKVMGLSPYLYGIAQVDERKIVVVGLWLDQVKKVTPYWQVTGSNNFSRNDQKSALMGTNIATKLKLKTGQAIKISNENGGPGQEVVIKGIVKTGSTEDNQIFVNLPVAQQIFSLQGKSNIVYFSLVGKSDELNAEAKKINSSVTGVNLAPIKQISKSEGKILEKIKSLVYLVIVVILLSTLLCVSTTMITMVTERSKEIGLKKALGAQNFSIIKEFLGEGLTLGLLGGLLGAILGIGLAQIIGQSVFHSYISFRIEVVMAVIFMSLAVSGIASVVPVKMATGVEPALTLKGE